MQMLLETCIETEDDRKIGGQQWALQEVRSLVCCYLHQVFIADTMLAKLVHFQVSNIQLNFFKLKTQIFRAIQVSLLKL